MTRQDELAIFAAVAQDDANTGTLAQDMARKLYQEVTRGLAAKSLAQRKAARFAKSNDPKVSEYGRKTLAALAA